MKFKYNKKANLFKIICTSSLYFIIEQHSEKDLEKKKEIEENFDMNQLIKFPQYVKSKKYYYIEEIRINKDFKQQINKCNMNLKEQEPDQQIGKMAQYICDIQLMLNIFATKMNDKKEQTFTSSILKKNDETDQKYSDSKTFKFDFIIQYPDQAENQNQFYYEDFNMNGSIKCKTDAIKIKQQEMDPIIIFCNQIKQNQHFSCVLKDQMLVVEIPFHITKENILFDFYSILDKCILLLITIFDLQKIIIYEITQSTQKNIDKILQEQYDNFKKNLAIQINDYEEELFYMD